MEKFPFDPYDFFGYLSSGIIVLFGLNIIVGTPHILSIQPKPLQTFLILLFAYIAGQCIASPSKWLLEDLIIKRVLKTPGTNLMRSKEQPAFWIAKTLFPGYYQPLSEFTQNKILANLKESTGEPLFEHIRFSNSIVSDAKLMSRLSSFLNKYGFSRNLCFVSLAFSGCILLLTPFDLKTDTTRYGLLSFVASIMLFYRYLKFFRQYSYELFNTYARKGY